MNKISGRTTTHPGFTAGSTSPVETVGVVRPENKPLREVVTQDEADAWLGDCCARLEAWARSVGHDAKNFIVPAWARPLPKKIPSVLRVDGQPKEEAPVLFDLPAKVKQKSRTSSAAKRARKAEREAYLAAQTKTYLK